MEAGTERGWLCEGVRSGQSEGGLGVRARQQCRTARRITRGI